MTSRRQRRRSDKEQRHASQLTVTLPVSEFRVAERVERLAYTRVQAATALGVSLATFDRRIVPQIATVQTEWGARLIPVAELERYLAERRKEVQAERRAVRPGRRSGLPPGVVARISEAHLRGESLGEIARQLNAERVPTSQGGRQWWASTVRVVIEGSSNG